MGLRRGDERGGRSLAGDVRDDLRAADSQPGPESYWRCPPARMTVCPVTHPASSEAKKTAAVAMSLGWAMRPSGVVASTDLRKSPSAKPTACRPSVSTMPGFSEFTRILRGPSSFDSEIVMASTAALVEL